MYTIYDFNKSLEEKEIKYKNWKKRIYLIDPKIDNNEGFIFVLIFEINAQMNQT